MSEITGQDEARRALVDKVAVCRVLGSGHAILTPEECDVLLAALRAPSQDRGAEEMKERAAALALTDCRSDFAKQIGIYPEWDSYAIDIARAIRALPVPADLNEGGGK